MSEEKTDSSPLTPGGVWTDRKPSFKRTLYSLFRRSILLKIRDMGVIASEFIATFLVVILIVFWNFSDNPSDPITKTEILSSDELFGNAVLKYNMFVELGNGGNLIIGPNKSPLLHQLINKTWGSALIPLLDFDKYKETRDLQKSIKEMVNVSEKFTWLNNKDEIKDNIMEVDSFTTGIWWDNADDEKWYLNLTAELIEVQSSVTSYPNNLDIISGLAYQGAGVALNSANAILTQNLTSLIDNDPDLDSTQKEDLKKLLNFTPSTNGGFSVPKIKTTRMHRPEVTNSMPINMAVAMFAAVPVVIAAMPDLSLVLNDKESHMMTFIYLMGASETAYWIVNIISTFIMCLIPYIVLDILFSSWLAMKGTDFTMLLVLSILFILSYIMFQNFLSTFFTKAGSGRVLTVVFLILIIFFAYLNAVYTMDAKPAAKHVFSIIPFVAWELAISTAYEQVRINRPPIKWGDVGSDKYNYPIWYAFMWLTLDIFIWGALFLLFNATNERGFGSPIIRWRDLLKCQLQVSSDIELENIEDDGAIITVDKLVKNYGKKGINAVDDVSFNIKKGEIIVMIGPNGAGKSSIINVISGAIPATSGSMALGDSKPSTQFSSIQNCLGIVFQDNVIYKLLSIREHLEIFGRIRGIDEKVLQDSIDFFADNLQLKEMLPNRAGDLSGGQKRKLCVALALLGNPPIIMMDEPTAGVDVQARQLIWKSISSLKESTCIITTHALEEAEAVSSRMFVVSNGKMPFMGTSTELRSQFKCGYVLKAECEPEAMPKLLETAKKFIPEATTLAEKIQLLCLFLEKYLNYWHILIIIRMILVSKIIHSLLNNSKMY